VEAAVSKADLRRFGDAAPPAGPILAVRVADLGEKEVVLNAQPGAFFTIPHFDGHSAVLVQLKNVSQTALREAIIDGWLACAPARLVDQYLRRRARLQEGVVCCVGWVTVTRKVTNRSRPGARGG
jgi:hypothetical protein